MKNTKAMLSLGMVCLAAVILQCTNLPVISGSVPYLTFCACSLIAWKDKRRLPGIFKILLFGLMGLPLFDFVFSMLTAWLLSGILSALIVIFLQSCVYFAAFVLINAWINKRQIMLKPKAYAILLSLILIYSALEGIHAVSLVYSFGQAMGQGNIFALLSAINGNWVLSVISKFVFYSGVFYTSVQLTQNR